MKNETKILIDIQPIVISKLYAAMILGISFALGCTNNVAVKISSLSSEALQESSSSDGSDNRNTTEGLKVSAEGVPTGESTIQLLALSIKSDQANHYRYKFGLSSQVSCGMDLNYSQMIPISQRLILDLSHIAVSSEVILCLKGNRVSSSGTAEGREVTVYSWKKVNPVIDVSGCTTHENPNGSEMTITDCPTTDPSIPPNDPNPSSDPVALTDWTVYTNSTHYYADESQIKISLPNSVTGSVTGVDLSDLKLTLDQNVSVKNGSVTLDEKVISYLPASGFYGKDEFTYQITNNKTKKIGKGKVVVNVMTPYTWTGADSTSKGTHSQKNFCGKVVSGKCDGSTFPGQIYYENFLEAHYVFDDTCVANCEVEIDGTPGQLGFVGLRGTSIDINNFSGILYQKSNVALAYLQRTWLKAVSLNMNSSKWVGDQHSLWIDRATVWAGWIPERKNDIALKITGGSFVSPKEMTINGSLYISSAASFSHNLGQITLNRYWSRNANNYAPEVRFYDLNLGASEVTKKQGDAVGLQWASHIIVERNLGINPYGIDANLGTGRNPDTWEDLTSPAVITVLGDVVMGGYGGAHCDYQCIPLVVELAGEGQQNIRGLIVEPDAWSQANGVLFHLDNRFNVVSYAPTLKINKSSGKVVMNDVVGVTGTFEYVKSAGYDFANSKLVFAGAWHGSSFIPGSAEYQDIIWAHFFGSLDIQADRLVVHGNFEHRGNYYVFGKLGRGTKVIVEGDLIVENSGDHDRLDRAVVFTLEGEKNQSIRQIGSSGYLVGHVEINKCSGVTQLSGQIGTMADFIVTSGRVEAASGSLFYTRAHGINNVKSTIKASGVSFESLEIQHGTELASDLVTKNLTIGLSTSYSGLIAAGNKIQVLNDVNLVKSATNYSDGLKNIELIGSNDQTIKFVEPSLSGGFSNYKISINKSQGVVNVVNDGQLNSVDLVAGELNVCSSHLVVGDLKSALSSVLKYGGVGTSSLSNSTATISGTTLACQP
ncbi:MAG: hypothetical protein K1X29_09665 [Bdellovibrionales bacterium]|nr:hypothetical protein [Bdellovibrionales bacterium]